MAPGVGATFTDAECPNTFFLVPEQRNRFNPKKWIGYKYKLYLVCQHPPGPHLVDEEQGYDLEISKEKWRELLPWLKRMVTFLKFVAPLVSPLGGIVDNTDFKAIENQLKLLETITDDLPDLIVESDPLRSVEKDMHLGREHVEGASLRVLYTFLSEVDKSRHWGGLKGVATEDGNILWLRFCMVDSPSVPLTIPHFGEVDSPYCPALGVHFIRLSLQEEKNVDGDFQRSSA